jgi:hypothetical protein
LKYFGSNLRTASLQADVRMAENFVYKECV